MPRRSLMLILAVTIASFVCYQRADRSRYGRYMTEVLGYIDREYVDDVEDEKLFDGAVKGMMDQLDGYSGFTSRADAAGFEEGLNQKFGGIGIHVLLDPKTKQLTVVSPVPGTPAHQAGIRAGDKIVAIDGASTKGFTLGDAVARMKGDVGQPIVLEILHKGETKPVEFKLVRAIINVDSVIGDLHQADDSWDFRLGQHEGIGYLRVTSFGEQTPKELRAALAWLGKHGARGAIIDLRDNPGGLLESATKTCELFLDDGQAIVSTRGRDGNIVKAVAASGRGPYRQLPLAILVNRHSASASEIVAACLQDHQRAVIVGERTWGKGTVQSVIKIEGGQSLLRLTTASYWRPSGKNIHRRKQSKPQDEWGVRPDAGFDSPMSDEELIKWLEHRRDRDTIVPGDDGAEKLLAEDPVDFDPPLKKAVEYLEGKIGAAEK